MFPALILGQAVAQAVVSNLSLVALLLIPHLRQPLGRTVAAVGRAIFDECSYYIVVAIEPFRLDIGRMGTTHVGAFVPFDTEPHQGIEEFINSALNLATLIGVFHTNYEGAAAPTSQQPVVNSRPDIANMRPTRRTGRKPNPHSITRSNSHAKTSAAILPRRCARFRGVEGVPLETGHAVQAQTAPSGSLGSWGSFQLWFDFTNQHFKTLHMPRPNYSPCAARCMASIMLWGLCSSP